MKTKLFAIAVLALLAFLPVAWAQEPTTAGLNVTPAKIPANITEVEKALTRPGILPDNPFYGLKLALEKLKLGQAKTEEAKAELKLKLALVRLSELKALSEKGNEAAAERARGAYEDAIASVDKNLAKLNETKLKGIEQGMANHIAALEKVRARIENKTNIPEATRTKLLAKIDSMEGRANQLVTKIENKSELKVQKLAELKSKLEEKKSGFEEKLNNTKGNESSEENTSA